MSRVVQIPERDPRGAQLALTILAVLLGVAAYALVGLGMAHEVPAELPAYAVLFGGGYAAGHLLIRRFAPGADPAFFPTAGLLVGLGFAMIHRISVGGPTGDLAQEQAVWLVVGLVAFGATLIAVRDHRQLDIYTYTIGLAGVILLLLPIVPGLGHEVNGSRVWIGIGDLTFQPSELGKVLLVIFLASYLNRKKELLQVATGRLGPFQLPQVKHLGPVLVAWGVSLAVLFLEKDLGTSLLYFGIFVVMLWVATARGAYLALGIVLFFAGALLAVATFGHVEDRVVIWQHALDPKYVHDEGYQLAQGQFALASGGIGGTGLGRGEPDDIPYAATDFIFAAIGEELGLLGTVGVLLLFLVLVGKGLRTALAQEDGFGQLLGAGLAAVVGVQAFIIIGGVVRVIPLTGVTLPFVSYGGSSLVANFVILALLVRLSAGPYERRHLRSQR